MKFGELRTGLCLVQRIIFSQNWIFCNPFQPFQILLSFAMPELLVLLLHLVDIGVVSVEFIKLCCNITIVMTFK